MQNDVRPSACPGKHGESISLRRLGFLGLERIRQPGVSLDKNIVFFAVRAHA
jgi:hypothetical protein